MAPSGRQLRARPARRWPGSSGWTARSRTTSTCRPASRATRRSTCIRSTAPTSLRRGGWRRATSEAAMRRSSRAARSRASTARWSWRRPSRKIGLHVDVKTSPGRQPAHARGGSRHALRHHRRDHAARLRRSLRARRQAPRQPRDPLRRQHEPFLLREPESRPRDRRRRSSSPASHATAPTAASASPSRRPTRPLPRTPS